MSISGSQRHSLSESRRSDSNRSQDGVHIVAGRFSLLRRIGKGGFGEVFLGVDHTTGEKCAIKIERSASSRNTVLHEARVLSSLRSSFNILCGFPEVRWHGVVADYYVLAMSLLGPSLEDLHEFCDKFTLKTTLMLAEQVLSRLELFHEARFVHRDVKPDNFLMGTGKLSHHVYLVDFGLSKTYIDTKTGKHIPLTQDHGLVGTSRYASTYTHDGLSHARRDDMLSFGYLMLYFLRGTLPWAGIRERNPDEKARKVAAIKRGLSPKELCEGLPSEFTDYFCYINNLQYDEKPHYEMCRLLFRNLFDVEGFTMDYQYDWIDVASNLNPSERRRLESLADAVEMRSGELVSVVGSEDMSCFGQMQSVNSCYSGITPQGRSPRLLAAQPPPLEKRGSERFQAFAPQ